jgi:RNA polymerase sigma-70 factor (ECF subfamily)
MIVEEDQIHPLIKASLDGDLKAIENLIAGATPQLLSFLYLKGIPDRDVEDVAQTVLLQMVKSLERFKPHAAFYPWLRGIARHVTANYWRTQSRQHKRIENFRHYLQTQLERAPQLEESNIDPDAIRSCVDRLRPDQRELIHLKYFKGLSSPSIGEMTGAKPAAIRIKLMRIRQILKKCLKSPEEFSPALVT